ncbi:hypothetical protein BK006_01965 [bacterium CG10_49_38]|nr:MAG: hypothetical protein BK006_01965 [bacterium CG10_49_38]
MRACLPETERLELYYHKNDNLNTRKDVRAYILSKPKSHRDRVRAIFGHEVYYGLHELFPERECRYLTFLRQPKERVVSHYNFQRTEADSGILPIWHWPDIKPEGRILDFADWFDWNKKQHNFIFNFLTAHFFDEELFAGWPKKPATAEGLEKIKAVLDQFYFVGLTEGPENYLFFYHLMRIKNFLPRQNISRRYFWPTTQPELMAEVARENLFDQEIYDYAKDLNRQFKKRHRRLFQMIAIELFISKRQFELNQVVSNFYYWSSLMKKRSRIYLNLINFIKSRRQSTEFSSEQTDRPGKRDN